MSASSTSRCADTRWTKPRNGSRPSFLREVKFLEEHDLCTKKGDFCEW
jgi:hypothetical protein